jgi:hypothetical protein
MAKDNAEPITDEGSRCVTPLVEEEQGDTDEGNTKADPARARGALPHECQDDDREQGHHGQQERRGEC